jgi:hypothetical protein
MCVHLSSKDEEFFQSVMAPKDNQPGSMAQGST